MKLSRILLVLVFCLGWALSSWVQLAKYFHRAAPLAMCAGIAGIVGLLLLSEKTRDVSIVWPIIVWALVVALYFILYPIALRHPVDGGSDGEDALRVADSALLQGRFPYYRETYLHNPITPLPGALLLSLPFGHRPSLQNPLWLTVILGFLLVWLRTRKSTLLFLLIFVLFDPGVLDDLVVGGDYFINALYIAAAVWLLGTTSPPWKYIAAALLGVAICSRVTYAVVPPVVFLALWQQNKRSAIICTTIIVAVAAALVLPFLLYDPQHFSPLRVADKIPYPAASTVLPCLALAIAFSSAFVRLTLARVYAFIGAALGAMLIPATLLDAIYDKLHDTNSAMDTAYYSIAATVFLGLWLLKESESVERSDAVVGRED
ncbi:MAG TPA: hypothetical protein VGL89_09500 [Candidatus Koribacter sp.]